MSKPNLYLDVDGVILPNGNPRTTNFPYVMESPTHLYRFAPEVIGRLGSGALNIVWCTTWESSSLDRLQRDIKLRGGRSLELTNAIPEDSTRISQKLDAIIDDQAIDPTPFVWIDDYIGSDEQERAAEWFREAPHLLIRPDRNIGLNPDELRQVEEFAFRYQAT